MTPQSPTSSIITHMVYFTLKDASPAVQQKFIAECHRLKEIPGAVFFAVGTVVADLARPVNVRDFHVAVNVVFESREAHDAYQVDPRHQRFLAENRENWQQVRVFDCIAV